MSDKIVVSTTKAPPAIGPYSQAIVYNGLVFTSGQIPISASSGTIDATDIEGQTRQVMENLKEVLKAAGSDFSKVIKATIFITDMNDFAKVNEVYSSYFKSAPPARSTIQVARLPKDAKIEIEMIAHL